MSDSAVKDALVSDHAELHDTLVARRYFAKFDRITRHLARVIVEFERSGELTRLEARIVAGHLGNLQATFRALSLKYLMLGRVDGPLPGRLTFDRHESGFPVAQELMLMASDAQQAAANLRAMPAAAELKDRMVRQIVGDLAIPTKLQFTLSQRLYYEALQAGGLFWPRNDPAVQWLAEGRARREWLVTWSVYDSQANVPVIYLMNLEDSGREPFSTDADRWPAAQQHLMAQSVTGLKLLTIASGFDKDFDDLHPKRLRRLILGPLHSQSFTLQAGPLAQVLADAQAPAGEDWAMVWTVEDLLSEREEKEKTGWFSSAPRQIFGLEPGSDSGASRSERMLILPERPFQVLAERDPPGLRPYRKFVVAANGHLMPQR
jgi:hypothetical protein